MMRDWMINGVGTSLRRLMLAAVSTGLALSGTWAAVTAAAKSPRSEATEAMAANQKVAPGGIDELKASRSAASSSGSAFAATIRTIPSCCIYTAVRARP